MNMLAPKTEYVWYPRNLQTIRIQRPQRANQTIGYEEIVNNNVAFFGPTALRI
jgi:hypothetical protein